MADTTAKIKLALEGAGVVEQGLASVQSRVNGLGKTLAGLAGGLTVAGFAAFIKGSIDAADEMSKISQKTGVLVKDVAGLQLAFRQAGAGDQFAQSMGRLSKEAAGGGKALAELGVQARGSDGQMKTSRQLLGEVADKFAGMKDGVEKTAAAQAVFGKSGADLIPLLNAGNASLNEYDRLAQQLGLTLDETTTKNAEKFNDTIDLMGQGVTGIGRQIASQLLPTLTGLAGQFLDSMTKGDRLKKTADFLAAGLKGLYVVALGVVEVFSTVGKTLGGVSAAIVAALRGDFAGAAAILRDMKTDIGSGWKDTLAQMQGAWSASGNAAVEAMAAASGAAARAGAAVKGATGKVREMVDEFARLRDKLTGKDAGTDADFTKNLQVLKTAFDSGRIKTLAEYLRLTQLYLNTQPYMIAQIKARTEAEAAAAKAEADLIGGYEKSAASASQRLQDMEREADAAAYAQAHQVSLARAIEHTTIARLREQQAIEMGKGAGMNDSVVLALQAEIEARQKIIGAIGASEQRDASRRLADSVLEENKRITEGLSQSIAEGILSGARAGSNIMDIFLRELKAQFAKTVLQPLIQPVAAGMNTLMQSLTNSLAGALAGSTAGTISNGMSQSSMLAAQTRGFAKGGVFDSPSLSAYSNQVVSKPTVFAFARGAGLMGEAGPEAIMPLKRGPDGRLGVSSQGGGTSVQVVVNNHTGAPVQQKESTDSRGNRRVELVIGDMVSAEIRRQGSSANGAVRSSFGVRPALVQR